MLETESSRQMFEPEIDAKADSMFYAFGIAQALQQLADQYVFQGEMRGDLVATTYYTDKNLRELANFSATTANKYDSAYVYYRVINNCNYYIAHRDTTLLTGSEQVVMKEYAAVKAIRAWAYLQLAKNYGKVPFFTEPLTKISQIDGGNFPEYGINEIVANLAPDLAQYSTLQVPGTGGTIDVGSTNWGEAKKINYQNIFVPVDVVLGDLYLEIGDYSNAAHYYTVYLTGNGITNNLIYQSHYAIRYNRNQELPTDWGYDVVSGDLSWSAIFSSENGNGDLITYIPMAVNSLKGTTTNVPLVFGYNYYSTNTSRECPKAEDVQLQPSDSYIALSDSTDYYYLTMNVLDREVNSVKFGDSRLDNITESGQGDDSLKVWMNKYNRGNIFLYRKTTVWLRLAEAFNRMGYYDAAFAILKDGMGRNTLEHATYLSEETKTLLTTTYPLLSEANLGFYEAPNTENKSIKKLTGIHARGAGLVSDFFPEDLKENNILLLGANYYPGMSKYQLDTIVGLKMKQIAEQYQVAVGTTKEDTINAMEDIICDECALDMAFEGNRFGDLTRMARSKNRAGLYGANYGNQWFAKKLEKNNPVKDLLDEKNWYLPFK